MHIDRGFYALLEEFPIYAGYLLLSLVSLERVRRNGRITEETGLVDLIEVDILVFVVYYIDKFQYPCAVDLS